jgi:hypothetical protein
MKSNPEYRAKWFKIIDDYKASDLSMKKYAAANNINYYQIQYWKKKYNNLHKNQSKQFIKVKSPKPIISSRTYKISYGKLIIELPDNFSESSLLKILKVADQVV